MNIGIVGAGAMGSIFACYMRKAGHMIRMYDTDPSTVLAIRRGLTLSSGETSEQFDVVIDDRPDILSECPFILLFVKSYATGSAVRDIAGSIPEDATVISLQNGLGNREIISGYFDDSRIIYGSTSIGAAKEGPGTVIPGGKGDTVIGGGDPVSLETLAGLLEKAGLGVTKTDRPDTAVWKKVIINAGINPLGALLNVPNGRIIEDTNSITLQDSIIAEAVLVARALGNEILLSEMIDTTHDVCRLTAFNRCSMLQDITAGRKTEIDSINGAISEYGIGKGIPTPVNRTLHLLVSSLEKITP